MKVINNNKNIKDPYKKQKILFILPTKSLVNQVVADVYMIYNKCNTKTNFGVFTRDYRENDESCDVLVTVHNCLEILLLSPNRQKWIKLIKWIIFDEIHKIGEDNGGIYERLIQYINCPFICLSATLGNPEKFRNWIQSVKVDQKVHLIPNDLNEKIYKWSDLEYYFSTESKIIKFHPIICIRYESYKNTNIKHIIESLNFTSNNTYELYKGMLEVSKENSTLNERMKSLEFNEFFKLKIYLNKTELKKYSDRLKEELLYWISNEYFKLVEKLIDIFFCEVKNNSYEIENIYREKLINSNYTPNLLNYFTILNNQSMLPAIGFVLSKDGCDELAINLLKGIQENKSSIFQKSKLDDEISKYWLKNLRKTNIDEIFYKCLYYGIAVHHAGMPKQYRELVETFFRNKKLKIIFATSTLALGKKTNKTIGLNMPCKTSIFFYESKFLSTIEYQQMSGRTGRRNIDNMGNIIFFGFRPRMVSALLTSPITEINGFYALTPTLPLKASILLNQIEEEDKLTVIKSFKNLLNVPLMDFVRERKQIKQIQYHFSFSLQFLFHNNLINVDGQPIGLAGLVTRTSY
jgi:ATP-dependent RNA helicase DDX60